MKILAIDTSCDETAAAVTEGTTVLSNIVWSQAGQHAQFGGVMPILAQRMHKERIDWVIEKALRQSRCDWAAIDALAVTVGPGLAIALEVGIAKAKEKAKELKIPLIPINHIEGHLLSPLAGPVPKDIQFPTLGLVVSGGHTELVKIDEIGRYQILAKTQDDALGEALDKAARMLGLGYPGGAILEKMARLGNPKSYPLPLPMARRENQNAFSYSGLKTAFYRLVSNLSLNTGLNKTQIYDLAASFQNRAFQHLERVVKNMIKSSEFKVYDLLVGGGVTANTELRKRLRKMGKELNIKIQLPYSAKLVGDNAAMIGIAAGFKKIRDANFLNYNLIDREPRMRIDNETKVPDFSRE